MPSAATIRLLPLLLVCLLVGLSGFSAYRIGQRLGIADLQATGLHQLDLYATSLEREIGKYAFLPGTLGLAPEVIDLLARAAAMAPASMPTSKAQRRAGTLSIYVMDTQGKVLATSNWRRPDSFLGEDLSFRPISATPWRTATGASSASAPARGEPGYYLASALVATTARWAWRHQGQPGTTGKVVDHRRSAGAGGEERRGHPVGGQPAGNSPPCARSTRPPAPPSTRPQQYNRRALQPLGVKPLADSTMACAWSASPPAGRRPVSVYPVTGRFLEHRAPARHAVDADRAVASRTGRRPGPEPRAPWPWCRCLPVPARHHPQRTRRHLRDRLAPAKALQQAHDELERKVEGRTADLSAANQQLQDEIGERIRAERTLRAAQDELVQAGKLAVIGQLSTGIAHELNQPLAARTLSANAERFPGTGRHRHHRANLGRIADLVDRMGRITGQLRNFARNRAASPPVALCHAVDNALALLDARLRRASAEVAAPARSMSRWPCATPTAWSRCWST